MKDLSVLDLFSAAAGGWSLGMHRAGFHTVAACEWVEWRRALYLQNNPNVRMYDDVRTLTGRQLFHDLGFLPRIVVCQDISPANTKGKGVEGERSGLYFEAIRIIGEVRPRWFALEDSANLRTRGADLVLAALEELGYSCWPFVVRAGDIGANHERPRSWLIGCDIEQLTDPDSDPIWQSVLSRESFTQAAFAGDADTAPHAQGVRRQPRPRDFESCGTDINGRVARDHAGDGQARDALDAARFRHQGGRPWGHGAYGDGSPSVAEGTKWPSHAYQTRQATGPLEPGLQQAQEPNDGCGSGRGFDGQSPVQMGLRSGDCDDALGRRADWSLDDLADHLQLDDGLSAWVAQSRIAVGGPRGTSAASLIVEAFGDAVVPQIPEAIGRAILRTERALQAIYGAAA